MTDASSSIERIERAMARIEAASAARAYATDALARRHARLRSRIEAAVESLDALISRESAAEADADLLDDDTD